MSEVSRPIAHAPSLYAATAGTLPERDTWNLVDAGIGAGRLYCGVWRSEVGHWRIEMGVGEHELFTVQAGRCRVHREDGSFDEAGPGEALFIPAGFRGSLEVLEPVIKTYAIVAPQAGAQTPAD
jgi:uncharacterized cupin superfamily protein